MGEDHRDTAHAYRGCADEIRATLERAGAERDTLLLVAESCERMAVSLEALDAADKVLEALKWGTGVA